MILCHVWTKWNSRIRTWATICSHPPHPWFMSSPALEQRILKLIFTSFSNGGFSYVESYLNKDEIRCVDLLNTFHKVPSLWKFDEKWGFMPAYFLKNMAQLITSSRIIIIILLLSQGCDIKIKHKQVLDSLDWVSGYLCVKPYINN